MQRHLPGSLLGPALADLLGAGVSGWFPILLCCEPYTIPLGSESAGPGPPSSWVSGLSPQMLETARLRRCSLKDWANFRNFSQVDIYF